MDVTLLIIKKVSECKLEQFENAQSISKWPTGSVYGGNIIRYLSYLLAPFPRGLEVDLEGSNTFLPLTLSMHINRLGLYSHLYRCLFNHITSCRDSCAGI